MAFQLCHIKKLIYSNNLFNACATRRGWRSEPSAGSARTSLPEADLVAFQLRHLQKLLFEAAVFGALLWESERAFETKFSWTLRPRALRPKV